MSSLGLRSPPPPRQTLLRVHGLRLNVVEWGPETAEPIVLLHGLRADARTWSKTASVLADRYRLIALDQRGRGFSDWDPLRNYHTTAYVNDLQEVVDRLKLSSFILLGHSMGGATSLVFCHAYPQRVKALIIEDIGPGSSAGSDGANRIKQELATTPLTFVSRAAAVAFWRQSRPNASEQSIQERVDNTMIEQPDGSIVWRIDLAGIAAARLNNDPSKIADLWPSVRAVTCPALVMRGERSDFLSQQTLAAMADANSNIIARQISGASHYVHDDNFQEFVATVEEFLARLAA